MFWLSNIFSPDWGKLHGVDFGFPFFFFFQLQTNCRFRFCSSQCIQCRYDFCGISYQIIFYSFLPASLFDQGCPKTLGHLSWVFICQVSWLAHCYWSHSRILNYGWKCPWVLPQDAGASVGTALPFPTGSVCLTCWGVCWPPLTFSSSMKGMWVGVSAKLSFSTSTCSNGPEKSFIWNGIFYFFHKLYVIRSPW